MAVAAEVLETVEPHCERVLVAGSLRRRRPTVKDIELVVQPRVERTVQAGLFGQDAAVGSVPLHSALDELLRDGRAAHRTPRRWGRAYRAFTWRAGERTHDVDLFMAGGPARWGVTAFLRTGSANWNIELMRALQRHRRLRFAGGELLAWRDGGWRVVPTSKESDVFEALGLPVVKPADRTGERMRRLARTRWPAE